jgi:hypothetical protein
MTCGRRTKCARRRTLKKLCYTVKRHTGCKTTWNRDSQVRPKFTGFVASRLSAFLFPLEDEQTGKARVLSVVPKRLAVGVMGCVEHNWFQA